MSGGAGSRERVRFAALRPQPHLFPALNGLRGLAIVLVLVVHVAGSMSIAIRSDPTQRVWSTLAPLVSVGGTGVHLFFVLSGFLLFLPFARTLVSGGDRPRTLEFYRRRLRRIIPAYYVALVFAYVVHEHSRTDSPVLQFVTHALLIHNYSVRTQGGLNEPTWTMATEAQFYLLLPLIAAVAIRLMSRSTFALAAGALVLLSASTVTAAFSVGLTDLWPEFAAYDSSLSALRFLTTFGFGIAVAYLYTLATTGSVPARTQRILSGAGLVVFVTIFGSLVLKHHLGITTRAVDFYGYPTLVGLCYAGLLVHVLFSPRSAIARFLSLSTPRFLGDISYSVYLLHGPILLAWVVPLAARADGYWPFVITPGGLLVVVGPISVASFVFIERRFLRPAGRAETSTVAAAPGAVPMSARDRRSRTRREARRPSRPT